MLSKHSVHSSSSSASIPSHPQDSHKPILQCTLGNSQCQECGQTGLSNPLHNTYEEHRLWASSIMNETMKNNLLEELKSIVFRNIYQIKTANLHIQQWLTTQAYNISNRFSETIEAFTFLCTEIENLVRNFLPDLVEQRKLPDKNSSNEISQMPVPVLVNCLQCFTPDQDHSNNSGISQQRKVHVQSSRNWCRRSAAT